MKNIKITIILLMLTSISFSQIPTGYYNGTEGLEGDALRMELRNIITSGHNDQGYGSLYNGYETTDNFNGKVWDMYTMDGSGNADDYFYFNSSDECGSYSGEFDCYNREHSVPESWMGSGSGYANSDIFIVVPTDGYVNNIRSNYPYGENNGSGYTSTNGSKKGSCTYPGYTGTCFEPIDDYKGDFARIYFYVVTRYNVSDWGGASFSGDGFSSWTKNMLLEWSQNDPVSQKEIDRNNAAYNFQGNRNPYIDHPEWIGCVFANACGINFVSSPVTTAMETVQYTYNIEYSTENETETLTCVDKPDWLTFTKDETANTALLQGTPVSADVGSHSVSLKLEEDGTIVYQNFTIVVSEYSVTQNVIDEDFSNCPVSGWVNYSVASDKDWDCSANTISINGYGGNTASDDWYISPALNLDNYNNEILTFKTWLQYSDDGITDPEVKLKYSTNYPGSGDPSSATWNTLSYTFPTSSQQQTWTNSGNVDMSGITGNSIYLAFHYTSSGTGSGSSAYWQVDDVLLVGDVVSNVKDIDNNVKIFPNPAKNILNIKSVANISEITISNIMGQEVIKLNNTDKKTYQINIENLHKGVYIINFKNSQSNIFVYKFIKE